MIDIEDLTKTHYRGETEVRALRGVTCHIPKGSFTFIFGPSGSGKSTLLYLVGALDNPTAGAVSVNGRNLAELSSRERDEYRRHDVGFIFQSFNLLKNLDAVGNVLVPFMPQGISKEMRQRAIDLLNHVGLGSRLDHRPSQLSGGEQQRVAIARALLKKPALVLADEPTGELDSKTGAEVFGYLRRLHTEQQTTVVVVSHDDRYVTDGDRVLKLQDGQLQNGDGK
jgi:putative ABC transport system ATP-binding protein